MRSRITVACIAAGAVMLAPAASATTVHETEFKRCGSQKGEGAGWYDVRASHVSCKDARAVARKYWNNGGPDHVKVDGITYHCSDEQIGDEVSRARCNAKGERRVRFKFGA
jgi:hypothetical protein